MGSKTSTRWKGHQRRLTVEEQDVRLHAARVEDSSRQPQQRVYVTLLQQSSPDCLARPALEQNVVGYDDGGAPIDPEQ